MKPTATMLNRLRARPGAAAAEPAAPPQRAGVRPPYLPPPEVDEGRRRARELRQALRRADSEEAQKSIREELRKSQAEARLDDSPASEVARAMRDAALATPAPGRPGQVAVRLVGLDEGDARVPLAGLQVRAVHGERRVEGVTDAMGHALLVLDVTGSFDVEVLAPSGEAIARAASRLAPGQSAPLEIAIPKRPELEESFARGRAWSEEMKRRAERIEAGRQSDVRALERRVAELEAALMKLAARVQDLSKGAKRDDDGTKGDDHG